MKKGVQKKIALFFLLLFAVNAFLPDSGPYFSEEFKAYAVLRSTRLRVLKIAKRKIKIRWKEVNGATLYKIKVLRKKESGKFKIVRKIETDSIKTTVKNLKPGVSYYFKVRACKHDNCRRWSKRLEAKTIE